MDTEERRVPGTVLPDAGEGALMQRLGPMMHLSGGLSLGQICAMTGLEPSNVQNWVRRGFVAHPENKMYSTRHLARILLISALREAMQLEQIGALLHTVNGDTDDTGDDMLSEEALYDYFCAAIRCEEPDEASVAGVLTEFRGDKAQKARLTKALCIMACAWRACEYKKQAVELWKELKEGEKQ